MEHLGLPVDLTPGTRGFASGATDAPGAATATTSNIANAMTPICHWLVQQGESVLLLRPDRVPSGSELARSAFKPVLKLFDNGGTEINADARLVLAVQGPTDYQPVPIAEFSYGVFQGLTYAEQRNRENRDALSVGFPTPGGADVLALDAGTFLVLAVRADRSISLATASGTRIELPARRAVGSVVI